MDPNKTLADLREYIAASKECDDGEILDKIAELFEALDDWLRNGGFLPEDWKREKDA